MNEKEQIAVANRIVNALSRIVSAELSAESAKGATIGDCALIHAIVVGTMRGVFYAALYAMLNEADAKNASSAFAVFAKTELEATRVICAPYVEFDPIPGIKPNP